jgi:hypothetical protein
MTQMDDRHEDQELARALRGLGSPYDPGAGAVATELGELRRRRRRRRAVGTSAAAVGLAGAVTMVPALLRGDAVDRVQQPRQTTSAASVPSPSESTDSPPAGTPGLDPYPTDGQIEKAGSWQLSGPGDLTPKVSAATILDGASGGARGPRARLRLATDPNYRAAGNVLIKDRLVWVVVVPDTPMFVSGPYVSPDVSRYRPDYGWTTRVWLFDAVTGKQLIGTDALGYGQLSPSVLAWPTDARFPTEAAVEAAGFGLEPTQISHIGITEAAARSLVARDAQGIGKPTAPMTARLRIVSVLDARFYARRAWVVLEPHERGTAVWFVDAWTGTLLRSTVLRPPG